MQHLDSSAKISVKQRALEDNLWHLGKVKPETVLRPIQGPSWGYRYRARLSVRYVVKKGEVLVGFHERKSRYVADMRRCPILPPHVEAILMPLRELIGGMDARETLPQIELACGDHVTALVLRHMEPLSKKDMAALHLFAQKHQVQWWLQSKGPDTVCLMEGALGEPLSYELPEFGISMPFKPTDFTQVNPHINRVLVTRALRLLDVRPHERVIDWFCGLGNFTLPLATLGREVLGIEGSEALVARSGENYLFNQLNRSKPLAPTRFVARNLFEMTPELLSQDGSADKWLVDPPREGAYSLVQTLAQMHQQPEMRQGWTPPKRIVYVSCDAATFARDIAVLRESGYELGDLEAFDLFPMTEHVELVGVLDRRS
jgi:23S rRNA (uracil1939-C5)-methyltransferase